jgi:hypothetical protein
VRDKQCDGRKAQPCGFGKDLGGHVRLFELKTDAGIGDTVLITKCVIELSDNRVDRLDVFRIEHHNNIGIRGDSVVLRSAERGRDSRIYFVGNGVDRTCQNLQSVGSFELDVELAVAALEPTNQEVTRDGVRRRSRFEFGRDVHGERYIATTAGEDFFVGDPVKVDHAATC